MHVEDQERPGRNQHGGIVIVESPGRRARAERYQRLRRQSSRQLDRFAGGESLQPFALGTRRNKGDGGVMHHAARAGTNFPGSHPGIFGEVGGHHEIEPRNDSLRGNRVGLGQRNDHVRPDVPAIAPLDGSGLIAARRLRARRRPPRKRWFSRRLPTAADR